MAGGRGAGAVEGLEDPLLLGLRDARAAVDDAHQDAAADVARAHGHGMAAGVPVRVLEQVREGALELGGVGAHGRQVGVDGELEGARRRRPRSPRASTSSIEDHSGRGSAASASRRERSSRLSIRRESRVASVDDRLGEFVARRATRRVQRLGGGQDRGQRRAQVVRDAAQQRGLDHVAAAQRRGLDHVGHQRVALQRRRQQRLQRRARSAPGCAAAPAPARPSATSVPIWRVPSRSGNALRSRVDRAQLDRRAGAARTPARAARRPPAASPPAARRAAAAAPSRRDRSASWRRSSASSARRGATSVSERRPRPRGRRRSARPSSRRSAIVKRPVGGMWKKLNASALATAVASASQTPQTEATTSTTTR